MILFALFYHRALLNSHSLQTSLFKKVSSDKVKKMIYRHLNHRQLFHLQVFYFPPAGAAVVVVVVVVVEEEVVARRAGRQVEQQY